MDRAVEVMSLRADMIVRNVLIIVVREQFLVLHLLLYREQVPVWHVISIVAILKVQHLNVPLILLMVERHPRSFAQSIVGSILQQLCSTVSMEESDLLHVSGTHHHHCNCPLHRGM
jgi:hypothetical protein